MKLQYRSNLTAGIASIVFGVVLWFLVPLQISTEHGGSAAITSRSFPYAIAAICVVLGGVLVIQSLVLKKDTVKQIEVKKERKALLYMLMFLIYALLFNFSFIVATAFLGVVTLIFTGTKKKLYYVIVLVTVGVLYLLFTQLLHVRLP